MKDLKDSHENQNVYGNKSFKDDMAGYKNIVLRTSTHEIKLYMHDDVHICAYFSVHPLVQSQNSGSSSSGSTIDNNNNKNQLNNNSLDNAESLQINTGKLVTNASNLLKPDTVTLLDSAHDLTLLPILDANKHTTAAVSIFIASRPVGIVQIDKVDSVAQFVSCWKSEISSTIDHNHLHVVQRQKKKLQEVEEKQKILQLQQEQGIDILANNLKSKAELNSSSVSANSSNDITLEKKQNDSNPKIESKQTISSSVRDSLAKRKSEFLEKKSILISCFTWNVGGFMDFKQENFSALKLSLECLRSQYTLHDHEIFILGLEEVIPLSASTAVSSAQSEAQKSWISIMKSLLGDKYEIVDSQHLFGMLLLVFADSELAEHNISSVRTASVGTGLLGLMGNKGGVSLSMRLGRDKNAGIPGYSCFFADIHLSAGEDHHAVARRRWDLKELENRLTNLPVTRTWKLFNSVEDPSSETSVSATKNDSNLVTPTLAPVLSATNNTLNSASILATDPANNGLSNNSISSNKSSNLEKLDDKLNVIASKNNSNETIDKKPIATLDSRRKSFTNSSIASDTISDSSSLSSDKFSKLSLSSNTTDNNSSLVTTESINSNMANSSTGADTASNLTSTPVNKSTMKSPLTSKQIPSSGPLAIIMGDLNFRINFDNESVFSMIDQKNYSNLLIGDQLTKELSSSRCFSGFKESAINFPPTYKYVIGSTSVYDKGEKNRIPSYTDRILYTPLQNLKPLDYTHHPAFVFSDHKPVTASFLFTTDLINSEKRSKIYREILREMDIIENTSRPSIEISPVDYYFDDCLVATTKSCKFFVTNNSDFPISYHISLHPQTKGLPEPKVSPMESHIGAYSTKTITVEQYIPVCTVSASNIIIVHIKDSQDFFCTFQYDCLPSVYGSSLGSLKQRITTLVYAPPGTLNGTNKKTISVPRELFKFVEYLAPRIVPDMFEGNGNIVLEEIVRQWIDQNLDFDSKTLDSFIGNIGVYSVADQLYAFLKYLSDGIIPADVYNVVLKGSKGAEDIYQGLKAPYTNALLYIVSFLMLMVQKGADKDKLIKKFTPLIIRKPDNFKVTAKTEKAEYDFMSKLIN